MISATLSSEMPYVPNILAERIIGDLRYLQRMGQTRSVMIALRRDKHLRFAFQSPKRLTM